MLILIQHGSFMCFTSSELTANLNLLIDLSALNYDNCRSVITQELCFFPPFYFIFFLLKI